MPVVFRLFLIRGKCSPHHNQGEGPQPHLACHTLHQGSSQVQEYEDCPGLKAREGCVHTRVHLQGASCAAGLTHVCSVDRNWPTCM